MHVLITHARVDTHTRSYVQFGVQSSYLDLCTIIHARVDAIKHARVWHARVDAHARTPIQRVARTGASRRESLPDSRRTGAVGLHAAGDLKHGKTLIVQIM